MKPRRGFSKPSWKHLIVFMPTVLFAAYVSAQSVPSGWKVVQVRYANPIPEIWEKAAKAAGPPGRCQIAVPPDWKTSTLANGGALAEAPASTYMHPFSADVEADVPGPTFAQQVELIKKNDKSLNVQGPAVIEDSAQRYWTSQKPVSGTTEWRVTVPGHPNCEVTLRFPEAVANEATAKAIAATLAPAK